jgi:hypothetical protein
MALGSHHGEMMLSCENIGPYNLFNMTASFYHDGNIGPYNLFNMTALFHHDGNIFPYNLFNMTASFHHDVPSQ